MIDARNPHRDALGEGGATDAIQGTGRHGVKQEAGIRCPALGEHPQKGSVRKTDRSEMQRKYRQPRATLD